MADSRFALSGTIVVTMGREIGYEGLTSDGYVAVPGDARFGMEISSLPKPVFDRVVQVLRPIFPELASVDVEATAKRTLKEAKRFRQAGTGTAPSDVQNQMRGMLRLAMGRLGKDPVVDAMRKYLKPDEPTNLTRISWEFYDDLADDIRELLEAAGFDPDEGPTKIGITGGDVATAREIEYANRFRDREDNFEVPGEMPSTKTERLIVNAAPQVRELDLDEEF